MTDPKLKELRDQLAKSQHYSHDDSDKEAFIKHFTSLGHDAELAAQEYDKKKSAELIQQSKIVTSKPDFKTKIIQYLPKTWIDTIEGLYEHSNTPFEMAAAMTLGIASCATSPRFDVSKVWGEPGDSIPISEFIVIIDAPGGSKSTTLSILQKPIKEYLRRDYEDFKLNRSLWNEMEDKRFTSEKKAYTPGDVNLPRPPAYKRGAYEIQVNSTVPVFVEDLYKTTNTDYITSEGGSVLAGHPFTDETRAIEIATMLCSLWDGDEVSKKKNEVRVVLNNKRVNICICLQPVTSALLFSCKMFDELGLNSRMLVVDTPPHKKNSLKLNDPAHRLIKDAALAKVEPYREVLRKILALPLKTRIDYDCELLPDVVTLDQTAIDYISPVFDEYLENEDKNYEDVGTLAKRAIEHILRIAATIAIYRVSEMWDGYELEKMRKNIRILEIDIKCAHEMFKMFMYNKAHLSLPAVETIDNKELTVVNNILHYMKVKNLKEMSYSKLTQNIWSFKNLGAEARQRVLDEGFKLEKWLYDPSEKTLTLWEE